jgi:anti-sigma regulatory factor (Ser/Thr protein kinase)
MTELQAALVVESEPCGATNGEVVQLSPDTTGERVNANFAAEAGSVREARMFVRTQLAGRSAVMIRDTVLMVSELATNCIKHARSPYRVSLVSDGPAICVEVLDSGPGIPRPQPLDDQRSSGRGLHIVKELSDTWGITAEKHAGKTVWFTIDAATS